MVILHMKEERSRFPFFLFFSLSAKKEKERKHSKGTALLCKAKHQNAHFPVHSHTCTLGKAGARDQ